MDRQPYMGITCPFCNGISYIYNLTADEVLTYKHEECPLRESEDKEIAMKIERMTEIETNDIQIGDRLRVGHYTATCQKITDDGAVFLLDQYLDEAYPMNRKDTNKGGYEESDLRKALQSDEVLNIFAGIRDYMVPFDNGDLLRIPLFGEIFGQEDAEYFEPDGCEQWELMKDRKNRIVFRQNCWEWGWLQNKRKGSATAFAIVGSNGSADSNDASDSLGIRPAFLIN